MSKAVHISQLETFNYKVRPLYLDSCQRECHMKFGNYYKFNYSILFATETFGCQSFSFHILEWKFCNADLGSIWVLCVTGHKILSINLGKF